MRTCGEDVKLVLWCVLEGFDRTITPESNISASWNGTRAGSLQSKVLGENCSAAGQSSCREEKAKKERTFSGNMSQPVGELNIHRVVEFRQSKYTTR